MGAPSSTCGCAVQQGLGLDRNIATGGPVVAWLWPVRLMAILERERSRWLLWLPVTLGSGIVALFALAAEPPLWCGWLAAGLGTAGTVAATRGWRGGAGVAEALLLAAAAVCFGFALAQWRLHTVAAPILARGRLSSRRAGNRPRPVAERRAGSAGPRHPGRRATGGDARHHPCQSPARAGGSRPWRPGAAAGPPAAALGANPAWRVRLCTPSLVRGSGSNGLQPRTRGAPAGSGRRLRLGDRGDAVGDRQAD